MKIRFISDIHSALNQEYATEAFKLYMNEKEPADVTLIAGDMDADIEEAKEFLNTYFKDEKVVFIGGNHIVYNTRQLPIQTLLKNYQQEFTGQWKFLENDYIWLNDDIAVIGTIGWTDFLFGHQTKSQYVKEVKQEKAYREEHKYMESLIEGDSTLVPVIYGPLPDDPAEYYDELGMGNKSSYQGRRMKDAIRNMNDYNYGRYERSTGVDYLRPQDTLKMHRRALREIKRCYDEIVAKNPNATIILMTHHPFTTKCESARFHGDPLNAAFISNHDLWFKKFPNIKYYHCGHVHTRFFDKIGDTEVLCNPMGYLLYYEEKQEIPFNINYFKEV